MIRFPRPRPKLAAYYAGKRVAKACAHCGKPRPAEKPSFAKARKFCSTRCAYDYRLARRPACPLCGKTRTRVRITCSAACGYQWRKARLRTQKKCRGCGEAFWPVKPAHVWCGWKCYAAHRGLRFKTRTLTCKQCAGVFTRTEAAATRVKHNFCSQTCFSAWNRGANNPLYRGDHDPNRGGAWRRLAEEIRKRDGHVCQRCTKTQVENKQKLSVDHIIPWRHFEDKAVANRPGNLVSLCRRCHSIKTTTYERQWLEGDRIGLEQYRRAIQLPPLFAHVEVPT